MGKTIKNTTANASPHKFAWYSGDPAQYPFLLNGKTITSAYPGTKYTSGGSCVEIVCDNMLLVITTPIKYHAYGEKLPLKHQLWLEFEDGSSMTFTIQMWGSMFCYKADENGLPEGYKINKSPAPLEDGFDELYFEKLLSGVKQNLSAKAFLATEQRIPGLGNGCVQDILFNAGIHHKTKLENFEADTVQQIRMKCHCDEGVTKVQKMKAILTKSNNLADFAEKYNQSQSASTIEIIDEQIYFCYPQCYCSVVKRVNKPISKTWCLCTLGFAQSLFEKVFDCEVKAELIESIKTGGSRCVVKIGVNKLELN